MEVQGQGAQGGQGQGERLNQAVQQQLNLEQVKTRAISLFKAVSRILEDFDAYARTNTTPKWFVSPSFLPSSSSIIIYHY